MLASFHKAVPQTRLNVSIYNSRLIAQQVAAFEIDMGLIEAPCHMLELLAEPWLDDKLLVVAAPGHPLASQGRLNHQKLRQAEWVFRETNSDTREEADYALLQHLAHLDVTMEIASSEAINRCVAGGGGLAGKRPITRTDNGVATLVATRLPVATQEQICLAGTEALLVELHRGGHTLDQWV
ncbi:LysR substrate-binding domain-containing protein [Ectopseudomonas mendocina]|uniref:LysR substrate-binding domain-containing protein n=1 Tax=Ectopseudomonas mendocina TaxID=300 RepID=UPI00376EB492